jgi:periplasmic protein TonB
MFEDAFVRPGSDRSLSLPAAIALHGLAIGAIVGSSVWFPGEPPEPRIAVTFPQVSRARGSGPSGSLEGPRRSSPKTTQPFRVRQMSIAPVLPSSVTKDVPHATEDPIGADIDGGDLSTPGLPAEGNGNGTGTGTGTGTDVGPGSYAGLVRPGGDVRPPELSKRVEPQYPEAARKARVDGIVILDAVIAATGEVEEVRVIRSAGRLLDDAAATALRKWFYRPATLNGRAVRVLLTVTVEFRIH